MDLEFYIKEGNGENGRIYMTAAYQDGPKTVLYDVVGTTQHPEENCPDGFSNFQPLKFYTSGSTIALFNAAGKKLEVYWDDWKIYKNTKPF